MVIKIKCDSCGKDITKYFRHKYGGVYLSPETYPEQFCAKCQVAISEKFHEKYEILLKQFNDLESKYRQKAKDCNLFKKKRKADLLKNIKVTIQDNP